MGDLIVPLPALAPVACLDARATPPTTPPPPSAAGDGASAGGVGEPLLYMLALPDVVFLMAVLPLMLAEMGTQWEAAFVGYGCTDDLPPAATDGGDGGVKEGARRRDPVVVAVVAAVAYTVPEVVCIGSAWSLAIR